MARTSLLFVQIMIFQMELAMGCTLLATMGLFTKLADDEARLQRQMAGCSSTAKRLLPSAVKAMDLKEPSPLASGRVNAFLVPAGMYRIVA